MSGSDSSILRCDMVLSSKNYFKQHFADFIYNYACSNVSLYWLSDYIEYF